MDEKPSQIHADILDLIIDGNEEPFSITYPELRFEHSDLDAETALAAMEEMESLGWIRLYILGSDHTEQPVSEDVKRRIIEGYRTSVRPNDDVKQILDDVDIWIGLTDLGRDAWRRSLPPGELESKRANYWEVETSRESMTLTAFARNEAVAHKKVRQYVAQFRCAIDWSSRIVTPASGFETRNFGPLNGVTVTYRLVNSD